MILQVSSLKATHLNLGFRRLEIGTGQRTFLLEELDLKKSVGNFSFQVPFFGGKENLKNFHGWKLEKLRDRHMMPNTLAWKSSRPKKVAGL